MAEPPASRRIARRALGAVGVGPGSSRREADRRVERLLQDQARRMIEFQAQIRRLENRLDAVNRRLSMRDLALPAPHDLTAQRYRVYSQNQEDGLTMAILARIGQGPGKFMDIGCGIKGGNSRYLAEELGWSGLLADAREDIHKLSGIFPPGRVHTRSGWITRENVNDIVREYGLEGEIDLLSIDIDGMDYWIWEALSACSPRIVIVEYNSLFGAEAAVTVPYSSDFNRKDLETRYFGVSLAGLTLLARRKGYRLVAVEPTGVNGYFVRDDVAGDLPGFESAEIFRMQSRHQAAIQKGHFDMAGFTPENGRPLLDLSVEQSEADPVYWCPGAAS
jgi:hypothetical protein